MNQTAISVRNLTKIYKLYDKHTDRLKESINPFGKKYHRDFYALKNVSFDVRKGEVLGIVGKNGSGKSTLLNIISGVLSPSSGQVVTKGKISSLLGLGIGFNPELTGIENIYFNGTIQGYSKVEMDEKLDEILSFSDIGDFIHQPIKIYSTGMTARLSFAVAVNIDPAILIVDEILAVGDELFRRKCYAKMEELFKCGSTVLFVSHSANTINEICSRAILLDQGEQILEGPPKLVTMHYQKYLFSKSKNAIKIRNEILQLNQDEEKKKRFTEDLKKSEIRFPAKEEKKFQIKNKEQWQKQKAFYMPDFKPKSTVTQKNYDVDIYDVHIRTSHGEKVNVLVMNEDYIYSFKIKFNMDAFNVGVGTPFKTEKGLLISSHNMSNNYIKEVKKGTIMSVDCHFKCIFLPGVYYTNAAVGSVLGGKRVVLNRILDALVFKVQSIGKNKRYGGLVNCNQEIDIKQI